MGNAIPGSISNVNTMWNAMQGVIWILCNFWYYKQSGKGSSQLNKR